MAKRKKAKRRSVKRRPSYAHFECVPSRWGPRGTYGRGYRCRGKGGQWVRQSACRRCPATWRRGMGAPPRFTRSR